MRHDLEMRPSLERLQRLGAISKQFGDAHLFGTLLVFRGVSPILSALGMGTLLEDEECPHRGQFGQYAIARIKPRE